MFDNTISAFVQRLCEFVQLRHLCISACSIHVNLHLLAFLSIWKPFKRLYELYWYAERCTGLTAVAFISRSFQTIFSQKLFVKHAKCRKDCERHTNKFINNIIQDLWIFNLILFYPKQIDWLRLMRLKFGLILLYEWKKFAQTPTFRLGRTCKFASAVDGVRQNQFARLFMDSVNRSMPDSSFNIFFFLSKEASEVAIMYLRRPLCLSLSVKKKGTRIECAC